MDKRKPPCLTLRVPANKAGRRFVDLLRAYANYSAIERIRVRYSGPRKHHQRDTKAADATTLRVYIDSRTERALWRRVYDAEGELRRARDQNAGMYDELNTTIQRHAETQRTLADTRSVIRQYEEHLIGHAENVKKLNARIAQVPGWVWWVIDIPKRIRAWRESRSGWVLP